MLFKSCLNHFFLSSIKKDSSMSSNNYSWNSYCVCSWTVIPTVIRGIACVISLKFFYFSAYLTLDFSLCLLVLVLWQTMKGIKKRNKDAHLKAFEVDLSSFQSIFKFKDSLEKWLLDSDMHCSIQLLINNAGILATSHRLTIEGYDQWVSHVIYLIKSLIEC